MWRFHGIMLASVLASLADAAEPERTATPPTADQLAAAISELKADRVAWRQIAWKSCLLDGLKESREKKKPVICWVFIDRPVDDERC